MYFECMKIGVPQGEEGEQKPRIFEVRHRSLEHIFAVHAVPFGFGRRGRFAIKAGGDREPFGAAG